MNGVRITLSVGWEEKSTIVIVLCIICVEKEDIVAGGDCVEIIPGFEVATKRALRRRLPAGNEKAKWRREVVDDVLERVQVGGEKAWSMRKLGDRLAIRDIDTTDDAELLEEPKE